MFEVKLTYSHQDLVALNRLASKVYHRASTVVLTAFMWVVGLFLMLGGVLIQVYEGVSIRWLWDILLGAVILALAIFQHHFSALISRRLLMKGTGEIWDRFDWDGFSEETAKGTTRHPYEAVSGLFHDRNRYFVFLDKRHAYILPEDKFVAGDPAEFQAFLEEKCGQPVRAVR